MNIIISNSCDKPIYEQITAQIKQMIISGELEPAGMLPSMRMLAKELRISVITTKRAYEDLERDGFIYTVVGKGSFVAEKNMEFVPERGRTRSNRISLLFYRMGDQSNASQNMTKRYDIRV